MTTGQGAVGLLEAAIDYAVDVAGIEALKPIQREAIRMFGLGRDVVVYLPTGFGKSVTLFFRSCSTV